MNYLVKNVKKQKKTNSDLNTKSNKKVLSPTIDFKQNNKIKENIASNSIKKNYFIKGKNNLGAQNYIKINNINESNKRDSNKNIFYNDFNTDEESKGDIDIYDKTSTNILTSTAINNESILNNTNSNFKRNIVSSSKSIKNKEAKNNSKTNSIKNDLNSQNIEDNKYNNNSIYWKKANFENLSIYKSHSNKEIKNNNNINNNQNNNNNNITQRCRHKQVKREIYINNNTIANRHLEINNSDILNSMGKTRNNIYEEDKFNENEKRKHKISFEIKNTLNQKYKNISIPITKINKNNFSNKSKKQKSLLDLYSLKNKPNRKNSKSKNICKDIYTNRESKEINNNVKRNFDYFKNNTINYKINRIKTPKLNSNYIYSENNLSNNNDDNLNIIGNNIDERKTQYNNIQSKEIIYLNECKKLNKMNRKYNDKMSTTNNNKRQYKRIKNHILSKDYNMKNNLEKNRKEKEISFDEDELDENTLSVSNGKYIENKKCQTMINKVFHFETGSNEIFNNFNNLVHGRRSTERTRHCLKVLCPRPSRSM